MRRPCPVFRPGARSIRTFPSTAIPCGGAVWGSSPFWGCWPLPAAPCSGAGWPGLAVLLDCVLLGIMILTLPCVACMVAALLLALSYITFRAATLADTHRSALHHASPLLVLWGALFLLTLGGLARSEVGPWAIQAPEMEDETTARVFFSPSCSACRQLVMGMSEADARKIIWCPVAEEEKDLAIILNLKKRIEMGTPLTRSFLPSLETEPMTFWDLFSLEVLTTQFRLWCNDARVISSSEGRLPLVEFMGIPSALVKAKSPASPAARPTAPSAPSEPMFGGQSVLPGQTRAAGSWPPPLIWGTPAVVAAPTPYPAPDARRDISRKLSLPTYRKAIDSP